MWRERVQCCSWSHWLFTCCIKISFCRFFFKAILLVIGDWHTIGKYTISKWNTETEKLFLRKIQVRCGNPAVCFSVWRALPSPSFQNSRVCDRTSKGILLLESRELNVSIFPVREVFFEWSSMPNLNLLTSQIVQSLS